MPDAWSADSSVASRSRHCRLVSLFRAGPSHNRPAERNSCAKLTGRVRCPICTPSGFASPWPSSSRQWSCFSPRTSVLTNADRSAPRVGILVDHPCGSVLRITHSQLPTGSIFPVVRRASHHSPAAA